MTTAVFVTPVLDPDSPVRGFATTHIRALASRFDRVVVVAGSARGDLGDLNAEVVTPDVSPPSRGALRVGPPLANVLAEIDDGSLVVVDDDLACLLQARSVMHDRRLPLLWWCPQVPSTKAATQVARWADALLVAAPPDSPVLGCPVFTVGAGIDVGSAIEASDFPERPPLQLIAVGRTAPRKGLPVILRAVAIARSQGIDARLEIIGPSTNVTECQHRQELECLVKDIALTDSVRIRNAVTPRRVAEIVRRAHVLIDAGAGNDMSRSVLEAMAAGRIVLSASATVAPMLKGTSSGSALLCSRQCGPARRAHRRTVGGLVNQPSEHRGRLAACRGAQPLRRTVGRASRDGRLREPGFGTMIRQPGETEVPEPSQFPMAVARTESSEASCTESIEQSPVDGLASVEGFLAALEALDVEAAMTYFEPGAVYYETTNQSGGDGRDVRDFLGCVGATTNAFHAEIHEHMVFGSVVVNERTDHWTVGERELSVPAVGVFEIEEGKIVSWSDTTSQDLEEGAAVSWSDTTSRDLEERSTPEPPSTPGESSSEPATPLDALPAVAPVAEDTVAKDTVAEDTVAEDTADVRGSEEGSAPPVESSSALAAPTGEETDGDRIAALEDQVHDWRRRAVLWRDRTIAAQTLADSLRANIDDLHQLVRVLESNASTGVPQRELDPGGAIDVPTSARNTRPGPNWKRLLSKDFWKELS